ncbi:MAG: chromosome segregation protein SMC [Gammaproteobacteria bacterium]|nr:chromosome segregation protein SMC [Gammaproteobacteria bacterium]
MRLEKIKLAGFKSFVDPTLVPLPGNLVGVVGPNGCGKSNVIDAVRWVMGESSAKMLRGESMADVIFNGSTSRKPVGTANIELVFDNTDGGAGGEYAQYNHISVKRQVSRDGQSNYFMNGVRCRRRDITDLFLGTGLGPRSYSIIEQGMISRLIEARPEELRAFLEEAAGISKYKERRRETQNRIDRTRENLSRLNDLRDEISKQLEHLKRQAATAERYKQLKEQERRLQAELVALRWRSMSEDLALQDQGIATLETDLEAAIARQRRLEAEIEQERERHSEANDRFNAIQGKYYSVGSDVARVEQAIQFAKESKAQIEQDLRQTEASWSAASDHRRQDETRLAEADHDLERLEPELAQLQEIAESAAEQLLVADEAMQEWQAQWEEFNRKAAEPAQSAQVERTRINHQEQQEQNIQRRMEKLTDELGRLDHVELSREIAVLESRQQQQQLKGTEMQAQLDTIGTDIGNLRNDLNEQNATLDCHRDQLQQARGRLASLNALQENTLGKDGETVTQWLQQHGAERASRLAERIEVESGWEQAVETVLGFHLQSVCVQDLERFTDSLQQLDSTSLALFEEGEKARSSATNANALSQRVKSPWPLESLLAGVTTVESLQQALAGRSRLRPGESLVTRDGIWVGARWLRLARGTDGAAGVLERGQEIRALEQEIARLSELTESGLRTLEQSRTRLQQSEASREQQQREFNLQQRELSEIRSALGGKRAREEHLRGRESHVREEQRELALQLEQGREEHELARERLHTALQEMETLSERRDQLVQQRDELSGRLQESREAASSHRAMAHETALRVQQITTTRDALRQNMARMQEQLQQLQLRRQSLETSLDERQGPLQEQGVQLELLLQRRLEVESELAEARHSLEQIDAHLRELEQQRAAAEQKVQQQRNTRDQAKMQRQEVLVRARTLEEQLNESGFRRGTLFEEMPADADVENWQEEVVRMDARIKRLGAINLAAIEEFQEQSERMTYLDAQHADISESLETLENAIRKIDRETRTRFKETFDKVNNGLQEKFPRLFGGGHAYLQLTGEDLLDTGVTVMARPPGKRNSSIQLLSGGEKALTAVAMVFAIFELNPAPFCMLDEVDAPLDDANVGRFCDMVKSMSDRVQFIFITHNKITMEIATHLMGVTMHEPGVSRLVSVDVEEAAQMAAM